MMTNAETIRSIAKQICELIDSHITPEGECLFDPVKVKLALELVKHEIEKSIQESHKAD